MKFKLLHYNMKTIILEYLTIFNNLIQQIKLKGFPNFPLILWGNMTTNENFTSFKFLSHDLKLTKMFGIKLPPKLNITKVYNTCIFSTIANSIFSSMITFRWHSGGIIMNRVITIFIDCVNITLYFIFWDIVIKLNIFL